MFENERGYSINCINTKCENQGDKRFEQLCDGESEGGDPAIETCKCYIPEKVNGSQCDTEISLKNEVIEELDKLSTHEHGLVYRFIRTKLIANIKGVSLSNGGGVDDNKEVV